MQPALRIAMIARRVHPAHGPGGLERHVFDLVARLPDHQVAVDLFAEAPETLGRRELADQALPPGVTPHWIRGRLLPIGRRRGTVVLDRITNYPWWSTRVAARLQARGARAAAPVWSVVHAHGLAGWGIARGSLPAPLVVTTHGLEEFRSHRRLKRWLYGPFRAGMRTVASRSHAVVTTDRALVPLVATHLGVAPADQVVIPNAVDPVARRALADPRRGRTVCDRLGLGASAPLLVSVGRLEANKGFPVLVAALARAATRLPASWGWVLVGDGPARESIATAVQEAGLGGRAVLAGRMDDRDLHSLLTVADWFVHPTLYEGSSLATLEAMAHGLPVIASAVGGLPDKVRDGETGFLVPPADVDSLAEALARIGDVDGQRLGQVGRALCDSTFSWASVVPQYVALYERLADTTRRSAGPA